MIHASLSLLCLLTSARVYFCNSFSIVAFLGFFDFVWVVDAFVDRACVIRTAIKTTATTSPSTIVVTLHSHPVMIVSNDYCDSNVKIHTAGQRVFILFQKVMKGVRICLSKSLYTLRTLHISSNASVIDLHYTVYNTVIWYTHVWSSETCTAVQVGPRRILNFWENLQLISLFDQFKKKVPHNYS